MPDEKDTIASAYFRTSAEIFCTSRVLGYKLSGYNLTEILLVIYTLYGVKRGVRWNHYTVATARNSMQECRRKKDSRKVAEWLVVSFRNSDCAFIHTPYLYSPLAVASVEFVPHQVTNSISANTEATAIQYPIQSSLVKLNRCRVYQTSCYAGQILDETSNCP